MTPFKEQRYSVRNAEMQLNIMYPMQAELWTEPQKKSQFFESFGFWILKRAGKVNSCKL
jgi:hypothetical protein